MTILYAVIGRESDGAVLVESSRGGVEGNFAQVASELLAALRDRPDLVPAGNRKTFVHRADVEGGGGGCWGGWGGDDALGGWWGCSPYDAAASDSYWSMGNPFGGGAQLDHYFHVLRGEGTYYVCLSDDPPDRQHGINFCFLEDLQREFASKYTPNKVEKADARGMDKKFGGSVRTLVHHYNTNRSTIGTDERVLRLTAEIDQLKKAMGHNIRMLLERSESLDQLVEQSDELEANAEVFKKRSNQLKKEERGTHSRMGLYGVLAVAVVLLFIAMSLCGPTFGRCRVRGGQDGGG